MRKTVVPSVAELADLVPHARPACGSRPVVGSSRKRTAGRWTMPEADVEAALHAARVGADLAVGGGLEVERREDLLRPARAASARLMP